MKRNKKRASKKFSVRDLSPETHDAIIAGKIDVLDENGKGFKKVHENELIVQLQETGTNNYKIIQKRPARTQAENIRIWKAKSRRHSNIQIQDQPFVL